MKYAFKIVKNFLRPTKSKLLFVLVLYIVLTLFIFLETFIELNSLMYYFGRFSQACMNECPIMFYEKKVNGDEFRKCLIEKSTLNNSKVLRELEKVKREVSYISSQLYTFLEPFKDRYEKPDFLLPFCIYGNAIFTGTFSPSMIKEPDLLRIFEPCILIIFYYVLLFPYYYLLSCSVFFAANMIEKLIKSGISSSCNQKQN